MSARRSPHPRARRGETCRPIRPYRSAQSLMHNRSPFISYRGVFRRLRACSAAVAQTTLPGAYGPSLSLRSSPWRFDGRRPMSARKAGYDSRQRSQTVMPRPPYLSYACAFGRWHLAIIECQMRYSETRMPRGLSPCVVDRLRVISFLRQPQDCVMPLWRLHSLMICSLPHSQRQKYAGWVPSRTGPATTLHLPNR